MLTESLDENKSSLGRLQSRYERRVKIERTLSDLQKSVKGHQRTSKGALESAKLFLFEEDEDDVDDDEDEDSGEDNSDSDNTDDTSSLSSLKMEESEKDLLPKKQSPLPKVPKKENNVSSLGKKFILSMLNTWNDGKINRQRRSEVRKLIPPDKRSFDINPYSGLDAVDDTILGDDSELGGIYLSNLSSSLWNCSFKKNFEDGDDDDDEVNKTKLPGIPKILLTTVFGLMFITALLFILPRGAKPKRINISPSESSLPVPIPSVNDISKPIISTNHNAYPIIVNHVRYDELFLFLVLKNYSSQDDLETPGTPQNHALWWLSETDPAQLEAPGIDDLDSLSSLRLSQRYALAVLYYATHKAKDAPQHITIPNADWKNEEHWMSGESICSWYGISCDKQKTVEFLHLKQNALHGTIPAELAVLGDSLRDIDLGVNQLYGSIPSSLLLSTKKLKNLYLNHNQLSGTIPTLMNEMLRLQRLDVSVNRLTGKIPSKLISSLPLKHLRNFQFHTNSISGTIPTEVGLLKNLGLFEGDHNQLTGTIPKEFGQLTELHYLQLDHNLLHGFFPNEYLCNSNTIIVIDCNGEDGDNIYDIDIDTIDTNIQGCLCCKCSDLPASAAEYP